MAGSPSQNGMHSIEPILAIPLTECKFSAAFPDYHRIFSLYKFLEMILFPALLLLFSFSRKTGLSKDAWIKDPEFQFFHIRGAYA
jgi:hypothetical protein